MTCKHDVLTHWCVSCLNAQLTAAQERIEALTVKGDLLSASLKKADAECERLKGHARKWKALAKWRWQRHQGCAALVDDYTAMRAERERLKGERDRYREAHELASRQRGEVTAERDDARRRLARIAEPDAATVEAVARAVCVANFEEPEESWTTWTDITRAALRAASQHINSGEGSE